MSSTSKSWKFLPAAALSLFLLPAVTRRSSGGAGETPRIFQIGIERGSHTCDVGDQVRLFVVLRLRNCREQEKRKSCCWKKLPGLTCGRHLESFQSEIFDAKHVPCVRRRTSGLWTPKHWMQAAFQG